MGSFGQTLKFSEKSIHGKYDLPRGGTIFPDQKTVKNAVFGCFWPFLTIFWLFLTVFGHFWPFLAVFGRFWPFLKKKVSEIMSLTCLPWPTTGATLHSVRIMQKCAQNVQKCAKKSFFGQILAKKRIFDAPKKIFLLFLFKKWIPLEKLDIKHVLYDFLHAISIIFKGVKKNLSIALSNYTRNSCVEWWCSGPM